VIVRLLLIQHSDFTFTSYACRRNSAHDPGPRAGGRRPEIMDAEITGGQIIAHWPVQLLIASRADRL